MDDVENPWDCGHKRNKIPTKIKVTPQERFVEKLKRNRSASGSEYVLCPVKSNIHSNVVLNKTNIKSICTESSQNFNQNENVYEPKSVCTKSQKSVGGILPMSVMTAPVKLVNNNYGNDMNFCIKRKKEQTSVFRCGSFLHPKVDNLIFSGSVGEFKANDFEQKKIESVPDVDYSLITANNNTSVSIDDKHDYIQSVLEVEADSALIMNAETKHKMASRLVFEKSINTKRTSVTLPTKNYLKLNLKKKVFSRKGSLRQKMLKRNFYKAKFKKKFGPSNSDSYRRDTCFKCGAVGHWSNKCPLTIAKPDLNCSNDKINPSHIIKLQNADIRELDIVELDTCYLQPTGDEHLLVCDNKSDFKNKYDINFLSDQADLYLNQIGFKCFRPGQKLTILRILLGRSTLCIMPTASGKSLCYQIPALICQV